MILVLEEMTGFIAYCLRGQGVQSSLLFSRVLFASGPLITYDTLIIKVWIWKSDKVTLSYFGKLFHTPLSLSNK